jgi:glycosyltransferase involved in cell wall biosynthesis
MLCAATYLLQLLSKGHAMFSIVTPNRDRLEHLKQAVQTWQKKKLVAEIVVVDYGSTPPIRHFDFENAEKIRIIRVEGTADWRIGHAINIGFDFASNRYIMKLDADVLVEHDEWLSGLDLDKNFFRGDLKTVPMGEVVVLKDHFLAVGGYNEFLSGWGFDDQDFYIRLKSKGLRECYIPPAFLRAIPHSNELRGRYKTTYLFGQINDAETRADFDHRKNTLLSFMQEWHLSMRTPYTVLSESAQLVTIRTEQIKNRYKSQDAIAETLFALYFNSTDDNVRRQLDGLLTWLIEQAGGQWKRPT